jgi:hypothetical protein
VQHAQPAGQVVIAIIVEHTPTTASSTRGAASGCASASASGSTSRAAAPRAGQQKQAVGQLAAEVTQHSVRLVSCRGSMLISGRAPRLLLLAVLLLLLHLCEDRSAATAGPTLSHHANATAVHGRLQWRHAPHELCEAARRPHHHALRGARAARPCRARACCCCRRC